MNILLTCAGRRNYLIRFFQDALAGRGDVIACDSCANAPAFLDADRSFVVPPVDHADYLDVLADLCAEQQVGMLISVHDLELARLAQHAPRFRDQGTIAVVSSPEVIATCQDKWATFEYLRSCNLPTPATFRSIAEVRRALAQGAVRFPLLIKPRWGVSSIGVERIDDERELSLAYDWSQLQLRRTILGKMCRTAPEHGFVFQELLAGREHGLDVVNDLDGRHVATLARHKLVMRAGNTDRAVSVDDPTLERLGKMIGQRLGHIGSLDCDVMVTPAGCSVLDLNPRFGGGYAFSHLAGANVPAALIAWANHEDADPAWLRSRPGVVSSKYDSVAVIDPTTALAARHEQLELVRS